MAGNDEAKILVLNGPNLNLLGQREPDIYGGQSLADIETAMHALANEIGLAIDFRQSNSESELIDWVHEAAKDFDAVIINAGGFTHTSVALMDALSACGRPVIEVHLSNIFRREEFRHTSYVSRVAEGVICGFGGNSYSLALHAVKKIVTRQE